MLDETRALHNSLGNAVDLVRFQWLEGKISLELEDLDAAEDAFEQVKTYFVDNGIAYDAALVSLDLALVYLKRGRMAELREVASEMLTIFRGLGIQRETFAALAFFNKALDIERATTMNLVQELLEALEKARKEEDFRPHLSVSS